MTGSAPRKKWRPRLRTVLLTVNLVILGLPVAGVAVLRVYESELVRRTESELIVQGVLIGAAFRAALIRDLMNAPPGSPGKPSDEYGVPVQLNPSPEEREAADIEPIEPTLDIARDRILPPAADPALPADPPELHAARAGQDIAGILQTARRVTLTGVRVTDFRGTVVASTAGEHGMSLLTRAEVRRALAGERVSLLRERIPTSPQPPLESLSRGTRVRVFVALPILDRDRLIGVVSLSRTPLDAVKGLYQYRYHLMLAAVVVILAAVAMSLLTSLTITRPVAALIKQAEHVAGGDLSAAAPLERAGTHDVELLSNAFSRMAVTLDAKARYVRTFADHVSHAFKTPLTSLVGTIELLHDHLDTMSAEDRQRFLDIMQSDTDRLQRLVKRLTELARAEAARKSEETVDVEAGLMQLIKRYRGTGLDITLSCDPFGFKVHMAPEALEAILSNLLDNAIRHGGPRVRVAVEAHIIEQPNGQAVEIVVADDGPGISEANAALVFQPFFTTAVEQGGSGLGLSIVQALLGAHNARIVLDKPLRGARFRVILPVQWGGNA